MTRRGAVPLVVGLAVLAVAGIVAMLLVDGVADGAGFALAALPLVVGGWAAWSRRRQARDAANGERHASWVLLVLAVAGAAGAAEPEPAPLPEVVVTAGPDDPYAATEATTATKTDTPLLEVPQAVRVVPEALMLDRDARSLESALQTVAGVYTGGTYANFDFYRIRGFDASGFTYLDGLPVDREFWFTEETLGLERIEVLRGPASVLYGEGPPGGLVNLVSKMPRRQTVAELRISGGSYDDFSTLVDVGGSLSAVPGVSMRLNAIYRREGTFVDFVDTSTRYYLAPSLTWEIGPRTVVTFLGQYFEDDKVFANPLPAVGSVLPNRNGRLPLALNVGEPDYQNRRPATRGLVGWRAEHRFDDVFTLRQNVRYGRQHGRADAISSLVLAPDERTLGRAGVYYEQRYDTLAQDTSLVARFATGPIRHTALVGVEYYHFEDEYDLGIAPIAALDLFAPAYGARPGDFLVAQDDDTDADAVGVYVQEQARLFDQLTLVAGFRWNATSQTVDNRLLDTVIDEDHDAITPRVGVVWEFARGLAAYASYAESFRPQFGRQTSDGQPLEPETGQQWEVGLKSDLWNERAVATLALFDLTRQNVATADPRTPNTFLVTGEQRARGLELEGAVEPLRGWSLAAGFTWIDGEVTEDSVIPDGDRLLNVPDVAITGWTKYTLGSGPLRGLGIGLGGRWYADQAGNLPNTFDLPAFGVLDLGLFYERARFYGQVNITNALDSRYFGSSFDALYVVPGEPVAVSATVGWRY